MASLDWKDWDDNPLGEAKRDDKLVLLFVVAPWCRYCREMESSAFSDARVLAETAEHWVPVRVDADRRPDLDSRYNVGGWPSVAILNADGELITGENYLVAGELLTLLQKARAYVAEHGSEIEAGIKLRIGRASDEQLDDAKLSRELVDDVIRSMLDKFDHRYGGWGEGQKFAHPESIDFAMVQWAKTGDPAMKDVVCKTLDHMASGGIHDQVEGGFFRFSTTRDWRVPHYEKVLDNNAMRLRCFLEAWQVFGKDAYKDAANGIISWLLETMRDPETGAFFGSQGDDPEYYALDAEGRSRREPPRIDRTIYTNWNAMTIVSLLRASVILERPELRDVALRAMSFLLDRLYSERDGMYHYWDGTYHLPGILSDQAYMMQALVIASQFVGDADLLLPAEQLAANLLATHRAPGGGFFDLPESARGGGALRRRNRSILENSVIAEALTRLSYLSRRDEFREVARNTLLAFTEDYKEYGYFVAGYARAVDLFLYAPLVITVVGPRDDDRAKALRRAAQRTYVPSRIVQTLDPAHDPVLMERSGYPASETPVAYLSIGKTTQGQFEDPEELSRRMLEVEKRRHGE